MTFVTLSSRYERPTIGLGQDFLRMLLRRVNPEISEQPAIGSESANGFAGHSKH